MLPYQIFLRRRQQPALTYLHTHTLICWIPYWHYNSQCAMRLSSSWAGQRVGRSNNKHHKLPYQQSKFFYSLFTCARGGAKQKSHKTPIRIYHTVSRRIQTFKLKLCQWSTVAVIIDCSMGSLIRSIVSDDSNDCAGFGLARSWKYDFCFGIIVCICWRCAAHIPQVLSQSLFRQKWNGGVGNFCY